jgi:hypothetical protein
MLDNILSGQGFEPEHTGGGCHVLSRYLLSGAYVWVSDTHGCDVPTWEAWRVVAYPPGWDGGPDTALFDAYADDSLFGLREAVAAALDAALDA